MAKFNANDYVDVHERIQQFYARFPEGRLTTTTYAIHQIGNQQFVVVEAAAYRTPDDAVPTVGLAWEPVPGGTPFTKDSELMNAETSAWGRAIVALGGFDVRIASANEVRNRQQQDRGNNAPPPPNPFATLGGALKANGYTMRDVASVLKVDADTLRDEQARRLAFEGWMVSHPGQPPVDSLIEAIAAQKGHGESGPLPFEEEPIGSTQ